MKTADYTIISYKGVDYKIETEKLQIVFNYLEGKNVLIKDDSDIKNLLNKYKLYDECFLENVNKL